MEPESSAIMRFQCTKHTVQIPDVQNAIYQTYRSNQCKRPSFQFTVQIPDVQNANSTRYVVKPEGVSNVFLTKPVNENLGVERHQRGVKPPPPRQIEHCGRPVTFELFSPISCLCKLGYAGTNCEYDIDECASSPCVNNGTCLNLEGLYVCKCPPSYSGSGL